jgi:hypothetical protein
VTSTDANRQASEIFFGETSGERTSVPTDGSEAVRRERCRSLAYTTERTAAGMVVKKTT